MFARRPHSYQMRRAVQPARALARGNGTPPKLFVSTVALWFNVGGPTLERTP
jgi:hypothetical protein